MVVVTTDHCYSLGEHGWLAKNVGPVYQEITHTPLIIYHPDTDRAGDREDALTSAVDVYPTLLEGMGLNVPVHTHSRSLFPLLRGEAGEHRDLALYGYFGAGVNVTDGEYTYLHPIQNPDIAADCYSTYQMPPGRAAAAQPDATADSIPYADAPVWRYPIDGWTQNEELMLFDVELDPDQERNVIDEATEERERLAGLLVEGMERLKVPLAQFDRLELAEYR
jgi:arylsulfatase A-like enzyme